MQSWSRSTSLVWALALCGCVTRGPEPPPRPPSVPLAPGPANEPSRPAVARPTLDPELSAPRTPAQRLTEAHREADTDQPAPLTLLDVAEFEHPPPRLNLEELEAEIGALGRQLKENEPNHPQYPDLLFRLADAHLDVSAHHRAKAEALDANSRSAQEEGRDDEARRIQQRRDEFLEQAKVQRTRAVKLFRTLATTPRFARYTHLDEALHLYGIELHRLGRDAEMREAYLRLIREFPTSRSVPHAYTSFADYYFHEGRYREAIQLYEKALLFPDNPVYAYARSKLAWCHLHQGRDGDAAALERSLSGFAKVIEAQRDREGEVLADARRGLVEAYVHAGAPDRAWAFFEALGETLDRSLDDQVERIERLARAYFRQRMYDRSTALHQELLRRYPDHRRACEWRWWIFVDSLAADDSGAQTRARDELLWARDRSDPETAHPAEAERCRGHAHDANRVSIIEGPAEDGPLVAPADGSPG